MNDNSPETTTHHVDIAIHTTYDIEVPTDATKKEIELAAREIFMTMDPEPTGADATLEITQDGTA